MILPTTYIGTNAWWQAWWRGNTTIEAMESFPKRTLRNRCIITTIDGPMNLTVPVKRVNSKQLTRDVEISYDTRWQHQHWHALVAAYRHTPYFDYYADRLFPWYEKETKWLLDLNDGLTDVLASLMRNDEQTRTQAHPHTTDWQGPLNENLLQGTSVLDLLFEKGPETGIILQQYEY